MKIRLVLFFALILFGCGKKNPKPANTDLIAPILVAPLNNEVCANGTIVSDTLSTINFTWNSVNNATGYDINIVNLLTNTVKHANVAAPAFLATLKRNTPYSWYVVAKNETKETTSESRRFYNAGLAKTSYAPFPAQLLTPAQGESLSANGAITLTWKGSSVENNIVGYDLYFDVNISPALFKKDINPAYPQLSVTLQNNTTYYWRIVTKDSNGNTSTSPIFQFINQ